MIKQSGIYKIWSLIKDEGIYIGSAINLHNRKLEHFRRLKSGVHPNLLLLRHYKKYGDQDLQFNIIEFCEPLHLIEREQFYIDNIKPYFNICKIAGSTIGRPQSAETRKRRSIALKGRIMSEETKFLMSQSAKEKNKLLEQYNGFILCECVGKDHSRSRIFLYNCQLCSKEYRGTVSSIKAKVCDCLKRKQKDKTIKLLKDKQLYKTTSRNNTGYQGVTYRKDKLKYLARVNFNGQDQKSIGYYPTAYDAAIARDEFILKNNIDIKLNILTR